MLGFGQYKRVFFRDSAQGDIRGQPDSHFGQQISDVIAAPGKARLQGAIVTGWPH